MKPTIIYSLFGYLGGGLLFHKSFIAIMFDQMFNLTAQGGARLRFAGRCFLCMAVLNEVIWRTQSTDSGLRSSLRRVADHGRVRDAANAADQSLQCRARDRRDRRIRSAGMCSCE